MRHPMKKRMNKLEKKAASSKFRELQLEKALSIANEARALLAKEIQDVKKLKERFPG